MHIWNSFSEVCERTGVDLRSCGDDRSDVGVEDHGRRNHARALKVRAVWASYSDPALHGYGSGIID